jgi:hypothetical protein
LFAVALVYGDNKIAADATRTIPNSFLMAVSLIVKFRRDETAVGALIVARPFLPLSVVALARPWEEAAPRCLRRPQSVETLIRRGCAIANAVENADSYPGKD